MRSFRTLCNENVFTWNKQYENTLDAFHSLYDERGCVQMRDLQQAVRK